MLNHTLPSVWWHLLLSSVANILASLMKTEENKLFLTYDEDDRNQDWSEEEFSGYCVSNIFVLCLRITAAGGGLCYISKTSLRPVSPKCPKYWQLRVLPGKQRGKYWYDDLVYCHHFVSSVGRCCGRQLTRSRYTLRQCTLCAHYWWWPVPSSVI